MMIIPRPLPDEFCRGHVGRIQQINSIRSYDLAVMAIRKTQNLRTNSGCQRSILGDVATLCGMSVRKYGSLHSFLPFSSFSNGEGELEDDSRWSVNTQIRVGMTTPRMSAYLCEQCVTEDVQLRGYGYWRRSHQTPGMMWCAKHECLLRRVDLKNAFEKLPTECFPFSIACTDSNGAYLNSAPNCIQSYLKNCSLLIENYGVVDKMRIKNQLNARAKVIALQVGKTSTKTLLSNLALKKFPRDWLIEVIPSIVEKMEGGRSRSLDSAVCLSSSRVAAQGIAIALTIMFDRPEDGLSWLLGGSIADPRTHALADLAV